MSEHPADAEQVSRSTRIEHRLATINSSQSASVHDGSNLDVVVGSAADAELLRRFAAVQRELHKDANAHRADAAVSATLRALGPDNPTAARCSTRLFVDRRGRARVAAIINPRLVDGCGAPIGLLGFFESENDDGIASAVLNAACADLRNRGCSVVRGPMAFSTWHDYRFVVRDFEPGWIPGEPVHPAFYPALWRRSGFSVAAHYSSTWLATHRAEGRSPAVDDVIARFAPAARRAVEAGISIRPIADVSELPAIYELTRTGFASAFMYSDIDVAEFAALYPRDKVAAARGGLYLASHPDAGPVGFFYTTPGTFPHRGAVSVAKTVAVDPAWRGVGVYKALMRHWMIEALAAGPCDLVAALMHCDGDPAKMGWSIQEQIREYALYERHL